MASHKLLIADGTNIVRRVYEAAKGPKGAEVGDTPERAAGALRSSWGSLRRALEEHQPTHFMAAFDAGGPTWRHKLYPDYKAHRTPTPEALKTAMPGFIERLNNAGLRSAAYPDVEADDVIATLAVKAAARGFEVVVLSTDKDMTALLEYGVRVRDHYTPEWRDHAYVERRFGVRPSQMLDCLALMGDDTDGIPGVDGIGPAKAAKLLAEYGSLAAILEQATSIEGIKGKVGEQLRDKAATAAMCRMLTELKLDVPLGLSPRDLAVPSGLLAVMRDLSPPAPPAYAQPAAAPRRDARPRP